MAKFKAAAVFSSNMVLQREKNVRVFGTGKNGESVIVSICGNKAVTEVADEKVVCYTAGNESRRPL